MTEEMKAKRLHLSQLSRIVKMGIASGMYDSVNEGLVEMYKEQGHDEIHSFKQWLKLGYVVRKGEKALLLWGEPKKTGKEEKKEQPGQDADEYRFFPLAYVFSNLQVEKLKTETNAL